MAGHQVLHLALLFSHYPFSLSNLLYPCDLTIIHMLLTPLLTTIPTSISTFPNACGYLHMDVHMTYRNRSKSELKFTSLKTVHSDDQEHGFSGFIGLRSSVSFSLL